MYPRRHGILLLLAAAQFACARTGTVPQPASARPAPASLATRTLAGCYTLSFGEWSRFAGLWPVDDRALLFAPPAIELLLAADDDTSSTAWHGVRASQRLAPSRLRRWRLDPASHRVEMVFSNGFSGVRLSLRAAGDSLVGRAEDFSDALPYWPAHARAVAVRAPCVADSSR